MSAAKTKFINKYGVKVELRSWSAGVYGNPFLTRALLGRGVLRSSSLNQPLETQREGIFTLATKVDSGQYVESKQTPEVFIVIGTSPEYGTRGPTSTVANLLICNSKLAVKGNRMVGNARGNLKSEFVTVVSDLPCSITATSSELAESDAGLLADTYFTVYAPRLEVMEDDQLILQTGEAKAEEYKVLSRDFGTYPNMVVMKVSRDIRA